MTGSSTQGVKTVLHPVSDLTPVGTSGWCRAVDRRA
jgi:hypothetical protein